MMLLSGCSSFKLEDDSSLSSIDESIDNKGISSSDDSVTDKVSSMIEARDTFVEGVNNFEYSREELDGVAEWLSSLSDYKDKGFARVKEFGHSRG